MRPDQAELVCETCKKWDPGRYHTIVLLSAAGYRLKEAELMFQDGQADKSDRLMRTVVRKNPNYAGTLHCKQVGGSLVLIPHPWISSPYCHPISS